MKVTVKNSGTVTVQCKLGNTSTALKTGESLLIDKAQTFEILADEAATSSPPNVSAYGVSGTVSVGVALDLTLTNNGTSSIHCALDGSPTLLEAGKNLPVGQSCQIELCEVDQDSIVGFGDNVTYTYIAADGTRKKLQLITQRTQ